MCITGIVEVLRQQGCNTGRVFLQSIKNLIVYCYILESENSNLSIYVQLPQNIFIGFSQVFVIVASYEYAYLAAPLSAQSLFMSLHFCSTGASLFLNSAYIYFFPHAEVDLDFEVNIKNINDVVSLFYVLKIF